MALYEAIQKVKKDTVAAINVENFAGAMRALAELRAPVDAFFDKVTVNAPDAALRANRLALLSEIRAATLNVADFSKIAGLMSSRNCALSPAGIHRLPRLARRACRVALGPGLDYAPAGWPSLNAAVAVLEALAGAAMAGVVAAQRGGGRRRGRSRRGRRDLDRLRRLQRRRRCGRQLRLAQDELIGERRHLGAGREAIGQRGGGALAQSPEPACLLGAFLAVGQQALELGCNLRARDQHAEAGAVLELDMAVSPLELPQSFQTPKSAWRTSVSWNSTMPRGDSFGSQVRKSCDTAS